MKIYTRSGDDGFASLPGGRRVRKSDPLVKALGALDELDAHIGLCLEGASACGSAVAEALEPVQAELLAAGAILAAPASAPQPKARLDESSVRRLESQIDQAAARLPELDKFIRPGGSELSCRLHVARAVCRRAEQDVVAAIDAGSGAPPAVLAYVNRLSDLLFVLARLANLEAARGDVPWQPPQDK